MLLRLKPSTGRKCLLYILFGNMTCNFMCGYRYWSGRVSYPIFFVSRDVPMKDCEQVRTQVYVFSFVQDNSSDKQINRKCMWATFMCRSRLSKCRNFSDNLLVIVIVSHNFSFVTRSYTVPVNCLGCWMTVVAWVVHNCLVCKPNIAPENAHASKNCSVRLICEKYLECEGCHIADW